VLQFKLCHGLCSDGFDACGGATINGLEVDSFDSADDFCTTVIWGEAESSIDTITASGQCFDAAESLLANLSVPLMVLGLASSLYSLF
jgi:hypothetical protein